MPNSPANVRLLSCNTEHLSSKFIKDKIHLQATKRHSTTQNAIDTKAIRMACGSGTTLSRYMMEEREWPIEFCDYRNARGHHMACEIKMSKRNKTFRVHKDKY